MSLRDAVALALVVLGTGTAAAGAFVLGVAWGLLVLGVILLLLGVFVSAGGAR